MDVKKLNKAIDTLKTDLGAGLLSCDIWVNGTGQPVASHNGGNSKATALFDQITASIKKALEIAQFPEIDPYYLFHLENGSILLVLLHDNLQLGIAIDPKKSPLGLILNIAVPNVIESLK